jgi:hypothetical protein
MTESGCHFAPSPVGRGTSNGPFYYASAAEPFGDTVDTHPRAHRVLVTARRTGDLNSVYNVQDMSLRLH